MISSMISGSLCQVLTNPIWVIRIRMQSAILHLTQEFDQLNYSGVWKSFRTILREEGVVGLYKGNLISQFGSPRLTRGSAFDGEHAYVRLHDPAVQRRGSQRHCAPVPPDHFRLQYREE